MHDGDRFDAWLEGALRRALGPAAGEAPPPRYGAPRRVGGRRLRLASGAGAALAVKAVTGFAAAALAVGVTGTALTGSPNPAAWGATVQGAARAQPRADVAAPGPTGAAAAATEQRPAAAPAVSPTLAGRAAPAASAPRAGEAQAAGTGDGRSPGGSPSAEGTPRPHPAASPGPRHASGARRRTVTGGA